MNSHFFPPDQALLTQQCIRLESDLRGNIWTTVYIAKEVNKFKNMTTKLGSISLIILIFWN